jgi:hypothetical protein
LRLRAEEEQVMPIRVSISDLEHVSGGDAGYGDFDSNFDSSFSDAESLGPDGDTFGGVSYDAGFESGLSDVASSGLDATSFYDSGPKYTVRGAQQNLDSAAAILAGAEDDLSRAASDADSLYNRAFRAIGGPTTADVRLESAQAFANTAREAFGRAESDLMRAVNEREASTGVRVPYRGVAPSQEMAMDSTPLVSERGEPRLALSAGVNVLGQQREIEVSLDGISLKSAQNTTIPVNVGPVKLDLQRTDSGFNVGAGIGPAKVTVGPEGVSASVKSELSFGVPGAKIYAKASLK